MNITLTQSKINNKLVETTNGRDLQAALGNTTHHRTWIKRALDAAYLVENIDYTILCVPVTGGKDRKDYYLTIESAKAIAMMQRSVVGKEVRDYYIALENNKPKPKTTLELLKDAVADLEKKESALAQSDAEKSRIYNEFIKSMYVVDGYRDFKNTADRIGISGFGRNTMLRCLRDKKWLTKNNKPYRAQIENKRFVVKTFQHEYDNGDTWSRDVVLVTEKGLVDILLIAQAWFKSQTPPPKPLPAPPQHYESLTDYTIDQYISVGWTIPQLLERNYIQLTKENSK